MSLIKLKEKIIKTIEENQNEIKRLGNEILKNPEMGYCEFKTSGLIKNKFDELDISYNDSLAITGIKAKLFGRKHKFNVCIICEMDAIKCPGNENADSENIAHACGHNAQCAMMLGCAIAFSKSGVMNELDGDITFMAVPAEEFVEIEFRRKLKEDGKIKYFGGKQQLIYEGAFDDVDMAIMVHALGNCEDKILHSRAGNLGFVEKYITFKGKAAHGSMPFDGVNALNAACLSILGIHSNRETFSEEEKIRIHPIITKGGDVVNSVPSEVCIDTYVRGATLKAIQKGSLSVDRAVYGAAQMVGADADIEDIPGYLPRNDSLELSEIFEENARLFIEEKNIRYDVDSVGSSDIGDLSHLIPTIQPSFGGFCGGLHSKEFKVADEFIAYILPTEFIATTVCELLYNDCEKAEYVKNSFNSLMNKNEYINYLNKKEV